MEPQETDVKLELWQPDVYKSMPADELANGILLL